MRRVLVAMGTFVSFEARCHVSRWLTRYLDHASSSIPYFEIVVSAALTSNATTDLPLLRRLHIQTHPKAGSTGGGRAGDLMSSLPPEMRACGV
jgi:hypothetical protein